ARRTAADGRPEGVQRMTLSAIVAGPITQHFGRPALRAEPTAYLNADESRAKFQAFPGGVRYDDVHMGTNVGCALGTPIYAPAVGVIVRCKPYKVWNPFANGGKGAYVWAHDGWFRYGPRMLYVAHLGLPDDALGKSAFPLKVGTARAKGQLIFRSGKSG